MPSQPEQVKQVRQVKIVEPQDLPYLKAEKQADEYLSSGLAGQCWSSRDGLARLMGMVTSTAELPDAETLDGVGERPGYRSDRDAVK